MRTARDTPLPCALWLASCFLLVAPSHGAGDDDHGDDAHGDDHGSAHTLFELVFLAKSDLVMYCFMMIIGITILAEICLEFLEERVSTTYHSVLQKMYKELMLLGLISFAIFILTSSLEADLDNWFIAFEFAHFVMFFVGVMLIMQTTWSVFSNRQTKIFIWKACNADFLADLHAPFTRMRHWFYLRLTFPFQAAKLQLFKHMFLDAHDLPGDEFSFSHYFCLSLDAHMVELVNVLPSSYVVVLVALVISERLVRCPPTMDCMSRTQAIYLFFGLGVLIALVYVLLSLLAERALVSVLKDKHEVTAAHDFGDVLKVLLEEQRVNGGASTARREIQDVKKELRPFLDPSYFHGAEHEEKMIELMSNAGGVNGASYGDLGMPGDVKEPTFTKRPSVDEKQTVDKARRVVGLSISGHGRALQSLAWFLPRSRLSSKSQELDQVDALSDLDSPPISTLGRMSSASVASRSAGEGDDNRPSTARHNWKHRAFGINATRLLRQAHGTNRGLKRHNSTVLSHLESDRWKADAILGAFAHKLPFGSVEFLHRSLDSIRFISCFYLAIYLTVFMLEDDYDEHLDIGQDAKILAAMSFLPVALANLFIEPYLTIQYATISTMICLNPLLVGETIAYGEETRKMMNHMAFKIIGEYVNLDLRSGYIQDDLETMDGLEALLHKVFNDWDILHVGFISKQQFVRVMHDLGLHFTNHQMRTVFRVIDPDQNGKIVFEEFWQLLHPALLSCVAEIKSNFRFQPMEPETPNDFMDNPLRTSKLESGSQTSATSSLVDEGGRPLGTELDASHALQYESDEDADKARGRVAPGRKTSKGRRARMSLVATGSYKDINTMLKEKTSSL